MFAKIRWHKSSGSHIQIKTWYKVTDKDKTKDQHKNGLVYYSKCPKPIGKNYLRKTGRKIIGKLADHCDKDKQSQLIKQALNSNHRIVLG